MRIRYATVCALVAAAVAVTIMCTTPTGGDEERFAITLSLEEKGRDTAWYRGEPVKVIVESEESLYVDDLEWTWGTAKYVKGHFNEDSAGTYTEMEVLLYWDGATLCEDSVKGMFDTIYVTTAGQRLRSNTVVVFVKNIPPLITALVVGDTTLVPEYGVDDTFSVEVTGGTLCTLQALGGDYEDHSNFAVSWKSTHDSTLAGGHTGFTALYRAPEGVFGDTVRMHAYDGDGGHFRRTLILYGLGPNAAPEIRSVTVEGAAYVTADGGVVSHRAAVIDTVKIAIAASDPDEHDLRASWSARGTTGVIEAGADSTLAASYRCPGLICRERPSDTVITVDTVDAVVTDERGDSASVSVVLRYGNFHPKVESLTVVRSSTDSTYVFANPETVTLEALPGDSLELDIVVSDRDLSDSVTFDWEPVDTARMWFDEGSAVHYSLKDSFYTDSIVIRAGDGTDTAAAVLILRVPDKAPVIDSIVVVDSTFSFLGGDYVSDTSFSVEDTVAYDVTGGHRLTLRVHARDTADGEKVWLQWYVAGDSTLTGSTDSVITYETPGAIGVDTLTVTAVKDFYFTTATALMNVVSRRPSIDSITMQSAAGPDTLVGFRTFFRVNVVRRDSTLFAVVASDPDVPVDELSYLWSFTDGTPISTADTAVYVAGSNALDTIVVRVGDEEEGMAFQRIAITVQEAAR